MSLQPLSQDIQAILDRYLRYNQFGSIGLDDNELEDLINQSRSIIIARPTSLFQSNKPISVYDIVKSEPTKEKVSWFENLLPDNPIEGAKNWTINLIIVVGILLLATTLTIIGGLLIAK